MWEVRTWKGFLWLRIDRSLGFYEDGNKRSGSKKNAGNTFTV
jgi:hypothetical protein